MNILLVKAQGRIFESSSFLYIATGKQSYNTIKEQGVEESMPKQTKYLKYCLHLALYLIGGRSFANNNKKMRGLGTAPAAECCRKNSRSQCTENN